MTGEHSTDELKRQWTAAKDRLEQARADTVAAQGRYEAALLADTGLAGHVVSGSLHGGSRTASILVKGMGGWRYDELSGPVIKKDGTPGERNASVKLAGVTDLGLYVEPTA